MQKERIVVMWFKKDLRIADNKALFHACQKGCPVLAIYVREPSIMKCPDYSHFHQYRIQESVKELKRTLSEINIPFLMHHGEVIEILDIIRANYEIVQLFANEETGNGVSYHRDEAIIQYCQQNGVPFKEFGTNGVIRKLRSRDERDAKRKQRILSDIVPKPSPQKAREACKDLTAYCKDSFSTFVAATKPDAWKYQREIPGETNAWVRLNYFLQHVGNYSYSLSRPDLAMMESSRLSAYLTFGNISIKQVYHATLQEMKKLSESHKSQWESTKNSTYVRQMRSLSGFRSRLHWHCHFIQKLESQPSIEYHNQNYMFDSIRNQPDDKLIQLWFDGMTGVPMIDAGMRCLRSVGWINFRMRATLVSFVCNTCLQPRQAIAHGLARIFVDYEPGIHYSQLQMQSGTTGINTIRIYNPVKQLQEKDSDLKFVRKRIPELAEYTNEEIKILGTKAGNQLIEMKGGSYPKSIVDIETANRYSREILWQTKSEQTTKKISKQVYQKLGSRKKSIVKKHPQATTNQQGSLFG